MRKCLVVAALVAALTAPPLADQFYVVKDSAKRPAGLSTYPRR